MDTQKLNQGIKSWSKSDRPREKLIEKGSQYLTDAELLAILLGTGTPQQTAVDLSRDVLASVNNDLDRLARQSYQDFVKHKGIGSAKAITLLAAMELGRRRLLKDPADVQRLTSSKDVYAVIGPQLMDLVHEQFWIILVNRNMALIRKIKIGDGGTGAVVVDKSMVLKHAIDHLASGIFLIHNHPTGNLKPSSADLKLTRDLAAAAALLDIKVHDHLIIGGRKYLSLLDEDLMHGA